MSKRRPSASADEALPHALLPARRFRVLVVIELSRNYGRRCLQGIAAYNRTHGPWTFLHLEREPEETLPPNLAALKPDGVIARLQNESVARSIASLDVPVVDLLGRIRADGSHAITADAAAGATAVFEHFYGRGHTNYAYCGFPGVDFSDIRCQRFAERVSARGMSLSVYEPSGGRVAGGAEQITSRERSGELEIGQLGEWVRSLPKPCAVFACNDNRGRQLLDACNQFGVKVPEEVAVVGVDNDPVVCELANPPLSSLDPDAERIGYEGAAMLDRLMRGVAVPAGVRHAPPRGVVARRSSEMLAVGDPVVVAAVHAIREHACSGLTVEQLAERVHVSRATLERHFGRVLQRTPHDEINRVRLERTRQLLVETDYKLQAIAAMTGFCGPAHLSVVFKATFGVPPGEFRAAERARAGEGNPGAVAELPQGSVGTHVRFVSTAPAPAKGAGSSGRRRQRA